MKTRLVACSFLVALGLTACSEDPTAPRTPMVRSALKTLTLPAVEARLVVGNYHNCVLKADGSLVCWGLNEWGETTVPSDLGPVVDVAFGSGHTCALKPDGTVACWGYNEYGQSNVPAGLNSVVQISAGGFHSCALKSDGTVTCWGDGRGPPAGLSSVVKVVDGSYHTCVIKADGSAQCFGNNSYGQSTIPSTLGNPIAIAPGHVSTCALKSDRTVLCWGDNFYGQNNVPAGLTDVRQVGSWFYGACALKSDGTVTCWGNAYGTTLNPPADLTDVEYLAVGGYHACAVKTDRSIVCFGSNTYGESTIPAGATLDTDATPPEISYSASPSSNPAGWSNTDVVITWTVQDDQSGIASSTGCGAFTFTSEGAGLTQTCSATNGAGLISSETATANIDRTGPVFSVPSTITVNATQPSGGVAAYNGTPTDAFSGVASSSCTIASGSLFPIGTTAVTCSATDVAGNPATTTFNVIVLGAEGQADNLGEVIAEMQLPPTLRTQLTGMLDRALSSPNSCQSLSTMIQVVRAQSGNRIPSAEAAQIIASLQAIKATMGCP